MFLTVNALYFSVPSITRKYDVYTVCVCMCVCIFVNFVLYVCVYVCVCVSHYTVCVYVRVCTLYCMCVHLSNCSNTNS